MQRPQVAASSKELVIALVGYAGAGCTLVAEKLETALHLAGYEVHRIRLSDLIIRQAGETVTAVSTGPEQGPSKLSRATKLQDLGDQLRESRGSHAVASLAIQEIRKLRGSARVGFSRKAFILDSLKHHEEVKLLREVYEGSFRLVAVHCERHRRERRLIGDLKSQAKYRGAPNAAVLAYMDRDEKDENKRNGQQVREAFYLADYFIDNNWESPGAPRLNFDLERFTNLVLGRRLVRPRPTEAGMYYAHAAALKSACLSRQVGAALLTKDGQLLAVGTNEVPRFGGGPYSEGDQPDCRCFIWEAKHSTEPSFKGCHNTRKKAELREQIAAWIADTFAEQLATLAHPRAKSGADVAAAARSKAAAAFREFFKTESNAFAKMPGVSDLIEFSRSIHAEMDALLAAARARISPVGCTLLCTTYPCHSCARHLVAAGITEVLYIEPYTKSLAVELHSDSLQTQTQEPESGEQKKMLVIPYTGVGPRMYEDHFVKLGDLKGASGAFDDPSGDSPIVSVRLTELDRVEKAAAELV